ncbi:MAG: nucleotidyltransferase family protein [Fervidicoccaceae archaeon]|jgi:NDP-sugar pyrophosphorylase family protein
MIALILAGGLGKRLKPYTDKVPKPMIEVGGKPILEWQVEWLKKYGIKNFIFLTGHLSEVIEKYFGNGDKWGVEIRYSKEEEPLGTAGAVKKAESFMKEEDFFLINGDIITNLNPFLLKESLDEKSLGIVALVPLKSPYGIVDLDEKGFILKFREKPIIENYWINAGVLYFVSDVLKYFPSKGNYETEVLPKLAEERKLKGFKFTNVYWKSIDSHKDLEEANEALTKGSLHY